MKVHLPTRAGGTRWTGHYYKHLEDFITGYPAFRVASGTGQHFSKILLFLITFLKELIQITLKVFQF